MRVRSAFPLYFLQCVVLFEYSEIIYAEICFRIVVKNPSMQVETVMSTGHEESLHPHRRCALLTNQFVPGAMRAVAASNNGSQTAIKSALAARPTAAASSTSTVDPFSPESLASQAKAANYGKVTEAVLRELITCVESPVQQVAINDPFLKSVLSSTQSAESKSSSTALKRCSQDRSHFDPIPASVVISVRSTEEVSKLMKVCYRHRIPVNPSGTRTGLEGSSLPLIPGVVIDIANMNKVLSLSTEEMLVEVQPGVEKFALNKWLKDKGYFFAVDPGSNACMGGYASTGASGTLSAKYGTMRENVRSMTVVLADGRIMKTRTRAVKSSVGYNLHQLFIGSEGTLCIVTELVLKVLPIPRNVLAARALFPSARCVSECVAVLANRGVSQLARAELLNAIAMDSVNKHENTSYPVAPTLFLEFHGTSADDVSRACKETEEVAKSCGCTKFESTDNEKEIDKMWEARRNAFFAAFKARTHTRPLAVFVSDVCVPVHKLPEAVDDTEKDFATNSKLPCPIIGHVADGNFHCLIPYDPHDPAEVAEITALNARMVRRALAVGGTASGEHGVGLGKMMFLEEERGPVAVDAMRRIKKALDPYNIMNPFKVFTPLLCEH